MRALFASDLHLDARAPAASSAFLEWLASDLEGADVLYLLGDLFESWVGDDDPDPHHERICAALRRRSAAGLAIFAMHGNRDFLLGPGFERRSGCRLLPDPVVTSIGEQRVLLTHGDLLCTDDLPYQELRTTVREPSWQRRVLRLPLEQRQLLAGAARSGSRAHTARQLPMIMDVNARAVVQAARASGVDWIIHGHTHRPDIHEIDVDGRRVRRVVLGAWYERASAVLFDESGARALSWALAAPSAARQLQDSGTPE